MSRSLYPSPKSVAVQQQQPVTEEVEEELCDTVPHLSLPDSFHTCKKLLGGDSDVSGELRARVTLGEFINELPQTIKKSRCSVLNRGAIDDDVSALFRRLDLREEDWKPYAFFEPSKLYTRNLVATDDETFTLILMCWNAGKESPIHDHPCDGCWMHVCEGSVRETRYVKHDGSEALRCVSDDLFTGEPDSLLSDRNSYMYNCLNRIY